MPRKFGNVYFFRMRLLFRNRLSRMIMTTMTAITPKTRPDGTAYAASSFEIRKVRGTESVVIDSNAETGFNRYGPCHSALPLDCPPRSPPLAPPAQSSSA